MVEDMRGSMLSHGMAAKMATLYNAVQNSLRKLINASLIKINVINTQINISGCKLAV